MGMNEQDNPGQLPKFEHYDLRDANWQQASDQHHGAVVNPDQFVSADPKMHVMSSDNGHIRFNSMRFAQALQRKGVRSMSGEEFHRQAVARGISPEELAWGGLHPNRWKYAPLMTPRGWQQYLQINLPSLLMKDQDGLNLGVVGNLGPLDHEKLQRRGFHVESHGLDRNKADGAVGLKIDFTRGPMRTIHDDAQHEEVEGHGSPHILHYKGFDVTGPNGDKTLAVEQVQSDWHQKKNGGSSSSFTPSGKRIVNIEDENWPAHDPYKKIGRPSFLDLPFGQRDNGEWENLALRMALHVAAHKGFDRIALPYADVADKTWWQNGREQKLYGDGWTHVLKRNGVTLPREADKIARSLKDLGVVRGQWKMPIGVGGGPERTLSTLELTPAAREHLIRNGLTPWGSDNPRDMVRAMKALPIRVSMRGNFWNG